MARDRVETGGDPMMDANLTMFWARALVDELTRCGVEHIVVAPGSRSAPLAIAAHQSDAKLHVLIDERSAGFFALGIAVTTARPVAIITTSGTAVANLMPAVAEADQAGVPLVVVTADRPPELRDIGANQVIRQPGIFGASVRMAVDLPVPQATPDLITHLRSTLCRAVATASQAHGPVHLNVPLREPLSPRVVTEDQAALERLRQALPELIDGRRGPWTTVSASPSALPLGDPSAQPFAAWRTRMAEGDGIVLVGPGATVDAASCALLDRAGIPILGEPTARVDGPMRYAAPWSRAARVLPDWIIQVGATATDRNVRERLSGIPRLVIDPTLRGRDASTEAEAVANGDPASILADLLRDAPSAAPGPLQADLARIDRSVQPATGDWDGAIPALLADSDALWVGSSQPIRDMALTAGTVAPRTRMFAHRGASGIDGIISSATGMAAALPDTHTFALVGDLTFLHDLNGLAAMAKTPRLTLIVVNNGGGGIFEQLPIAKELDRPTFEAVLGTPQKVDLGHACAAFGIPHRRVTTLDALVKAMRDPGVVEFVIERAKSVAAREAYTEGLRQLAAPSNAAEATPASATVKRRGR